MHPLLQRQLQKHLGTTTDLPPELMPFIAAVDDAYAQADGDRAMFEHSADLAAAELLERNRELTARNADLAAVREEAEAASRAKSEFVANMSHEIRTPLNGVVGMIDLLMGTRLDERQLRYAQVVKSSANALFSLISQILDFSKIEAGKFELDDTEFDLRLVVEDVAEMLAQKAADKGLDLACRIDPAVPHTVRGDPDRLRQILINLVNNAIKFTEKGEVVVRVTSALGTRNSEPNPEPQTLNPEPLLRFEVTDTGIGIPADRMHRLFKSFSQVDASTTRRFGGTGLGLAISKQLAELMGGQIGAHSQPGRGSTFWVTARLPVAASRAAELPLDLTGRRVLVVDDNPTHAQILQEQLAAWRVDVTCAPSGVDALRTCDAESRPFDLAILDYRMPDMDGLALAAALRARPQTKDLCLVLLSGVEVLAPERYRPAGFCAAMSKPIRQSQLFDTLMRLMAAPRDGARCAVPTAVPVAAPTAISRTARAGARILLAEDNEVNQLVATELLARAGYACDAVPDGRRAVDAAATGRYALVLMDCQMPELDGFEATRLIRQAERGCGRPRLPIVALTANAIKGDRERCLDAGMDAYVTKPLNPQELFETIETCLTTPASPEGANGANTQPAHSPLGEGGGEGPASSAGLLTSVSKFPAIDVDTLLARCMGDANFLEKMLNKFREQSAAALDQIVSSVRARDPQAAARSAHALKGAAANLAAEGVRAAAAEIEEQARAAQLDAAEKTLDALRAQLEQCLSDIPNAITRAQNPQPLKPEP